MGDGCLRSKILRPKIFSPLWTKKLSGVLRPNGIKSIKSKKVIGGITVDNKKL